MPTLQNEIQKTLGGSAVVRALSGAGKENGAVLVGAVGGAVAAAISKAINKMSDGIRGLPTSLDSMAGMVQQLAPRTGGLSEAPDLSLAPNNALFAEGKNTDIQANAMEQYTQMLAAGKGDMAPSRSVVSAMPGQMDQLSVPLLGAGHKSMDLYEAMESGAVTFVFWFRGHWQGFSPQSMVPFGAPAF